MFLSRRNPTSPSQRWETRTTNKFFKTYKKKKFLHVRSVRGFELKNTKRKTLITPSTKYYNLFDYFPYQCRSTAVTSMHKLTYVNYFSAAITFGSGGVFYFKAPSGFLLNQDLSRASFIPIEGRTYAAGDRLPIYAMPTGGMCYSLRVVSNRKWNVAEAAGTFCKILWHNFDLMHTAMYLPSKKLVKLNLLGTCSAGRVSNSFQKYTTLGNARASIVKKKKIISVRGVAMNPVDHPNGGRANTKQPLKNPWGRIAKKGK